MRRLLLKGGEGGKQQRWQGSWDGVSSIRVVERWEGSLPFSNAVDLQVYPPNARDAKNEPQRGFFAKRSDR